MSEDIRQLAIKAYNGRTDDIRDFSSCVIVDQSLPIVVTQGVIINFYYEYIYHPDVGLHKITDELANVSCKKAIRYLKGEKVDIIEERNKIIKKKKSKRTAPVKSQSDNLNPNRSKRSNPRPARKSAKSKRTK